MISEGYKKLLNTEKEFKLFVDRCQKMINIYKSGSKEFVSDHESAELLRTIVCYCAGFVSKVDKTLNVIDNSVVEPFLDEMRKNNSTKIYIE